MPHADELLPFILDVLTLFSAGQAEPLLAWDCTEAPVQFFVRCEGVFGREDEIEFEPIDLNDIPALRDALAECREAGREIEFPLLFAARKRRQQPSMAYLDLTPEMIHRIYLTVPTTPRPTR